MDGTENPCPQRERVGTSQVYAMCTIPVPRAAVGRLVLTCTELEGERAEPHYQEQMSVSFNILRMLRIIGYTVCFTPALNIVHYDYLLSIVVV